MSKAELTIPTQAASVAVSISNPVMDHVVFGHMGEIAEVMAMSGMMHQTLTHGKNQNGDTVRLPDPVVRARAFMIVEQAARWNQSPLAVMQAASFVHGRLMWEGKLVASILTEVFGIELEYRFGQWDAKAGRVVLPEDGEPEPGESDLLGVIVTERGGDSKRYVEGYVGSWKTTGNGSPWRPGAMKRQLRYRGAREWSRAFRPSAILGIVTDDEPLEGVQETPKVKGSERLKEKLKPETPAIADASVGGFDPEHVTNELNETAGPDVQDAEVEEVAPEPDPQPDAAIKQKETIAEQARQVEELAKQNAADEAARQAAAESVQKTPDYSGPFGAFWRVMDSTTQWVDAKKSISAFYKSDEYRALEVSDQDAIMRRLYGHFERLNPGRAATDEPTSFRLWVATQADADAVEAGLHAARHSGAYKAMPDTSRAAFEATIEGVIARLRGA